MLTIGLTGGIGSGKSTVAEFFKQHNIPVIDADHAARQVVEPHSSALQKITEHFGDEILETNGSLNRTLLRKRIFQHPEERLWLESLLHPLIAQVIQAQLAAAQGPYAILMSPLLLESGQAQWTQRILVIDIPETLQIQRTQERDQVAPTQIEAIMKSQWSRKQRLAKADYVIENSGSIEMLEKQISQLHSMFLQLAEEYNQSR